MTEKNKDALAHYDELFSEMGLSPQDAAKWVFVGGWNCCIQEMMARLKKMPLEKDTRASFAFYFQQMMEVCPEDLKERMQ